MARRDGTAALGLIGQAESKNPGVIDLKLQKALALRLNRQLPAAIAALDEALALEPYHFVALLSKGALVEQTEGARAASVIYHNALTTCPAESPASLGPAIARAREVVTETADALEVYLQSKTAGVRGRLDPATASRFDEGLKIYSGKAKAYHSQGILLTYPRLPAISFFERSLFPWFPELEVATDVIRAELESVLTTLEHQFVPYIDFAPGSPVNQWKELNHSRRWSSFFLWKDGQKQVEACGRCPLTSALVDRLPLARHPSFAPTVMFSALEARTRIPPHTGSTNARLVVHLPLILPGPAGFRVGNETRIWKMGEAWAFDDSIEHEAWNDADATRVVMIMDIWNPLLTPSECEAVSALMNARNEFFAL